MRRYARGWQREHAALTAQAFVPLSFAPGEAYQFDWSHEIVLIGGTTTKVKVAHVRLCHSRMLFVDVLATRIARAHGFDRTGGQIVRQVMAVLGAGVASTNEGDRVIPWSSRPSDVMPFRTAEAAVRASDDVPLPEFAGLAHVFLGRGLVEDAILIAMRDRLVLGRLREATRLRLKATVALARGAEAVRPRECRVMTVAGWNEGL